MFELTASLVRHVIVALKAVSEIVWTSLISIGVVETGGGAGAGVVVAGAVPLGGAVPGSPLSASAKVRGSALNATTWPLSRSDGAEVVAAALPGSTASGWRPGRHA